MHMGKQIMTGKSSAFARRTIAALLIGSALGSAAMASAEEAAPAESVAGAGADYPGEIVVTARNKKEKVQDVPLTINAISGDQMVKQGITNLRDIAYKTPGLIVNGGGAETLNRPSLRGLPTSEGDPTVAVFYDGAYISGTYANNIAVLDLERVEVVKGPVNSLYGRPAYAGAINYVSKVPSAETDGRISISAGNDGQRKASFAFGMNVIPDVLMLRFAAGHDGYEGGYTDKVNGNKAGGYSKNDAQVSFLFTPTSRLSVNGRVYYGHDDFDASPLTWNDNNCGPQSTSYSAFPHATFFCGQFHPTQHAIEVSDNAASQTANSRRVWNAVGKVNYDLDFGDLSAISTYTHSTLARFVDFYGRRDGIPFIVVSTASTGVNGTAAGTQVGVQNLVSSFGASDRTNDFAQELRFTSKQDKPLRYTFGAYYAKASSTSETLTGLDGSSLADGTTIRGLLSTFNYDRYFLVSGTGFSDAVTASKSTTQIWSGFAGAEYDVIPALTVAIDGRYASLKRGISLISSNTAPAGSGVAFVPVSRSTTFNNWTGRASLRYKITPDAMVYATVSNGVKPGGFNARATSAIDLVYGEEKAVTYEVGAKTQFFDHKVTLNGSLFLINLKGIQGTGPAQDPATLGLVTSNIGEARSKGFEVDMAVHPTPWLSLDGGVGYSDITYRNNSYDYSFAATCVAIGATYCDQSRVISVPTAQGINRTVYVLDGLHPSGSSKWTFSGGADVNLPINDDIAFFASVKYRYQSRQYANNQNISWNRALNRIDLRTGVDLKEGLRVTAFVDNVTNDKTPESVAQSSYLNDFSSGYFGQLPFPRRYGLSLDYTF